MCISVKLNGILLFLFVYSRCPRQHLGQSDAKPQLVSCVLSSNNGVPATNTPHKAVTPGFVSSPFEAPTGQLPWPPQRIGFLIQANWCFARGLFHGFHSLAALWSFFKEIACTERWGKAFTLPLGACKGHYSEERWQSNTLPAQCSHQRTDANYAAAAEAAAALWCPFEGG